MKTIIAGTRTINVEPADIKRLIKQYGLEVTSIVSGGAFGVDRSGERFAAAEGLPVKVFKPDWAIHGKAAGPMRNRTMACYADQLILIWNGVSRGSMNMKEEMERLKKPVIEVLVESVE